MLFFLGGAFWNKESKVFDDDDECDWVFDVDECVSFFISVELECVLC